MAELAMQRWVSMGNTLTLVPCRHLGMTELQTQLVDVCNRNTLSTPLYCPNSHTRLHAKHFYTSNV